MTMPSNNNVLPQSQSSPYNYEIPSTMGTASSIAHHNKMNGNVSRNANLMRYSNISPSQTLHFSPLIGQNISMSSNVKQPLLDMSRATTTIPSSSPTRIVNASKINETSTNTLEPDGVIGTHGIHEMLASLALMCLLSLLMAFLALFFLQRTGPIAHALHDDTIGDNNQKVNRNPNAIEYMRVFQLSVSLSTLTISLDLCCLFVCCIQFLSAVKLLKTPVGTKRTQQFLKKTSYVRICAIGAFLISIPIFFTGVILFTFVNFDDVSALVTSVIIGIGIVFCGVASVQNVYLWQWEKTKASHELSVSRFNKLRDSGYLPPQELSTLV